MKWDKMARDFRVPRGGPTADGGTFQIGIHNTTLATPWVSGHTGHSTGITLATTSIDFTSYTNTMVFNFILSKPCTASPTSPSNSYIESQGPVASDIYGQRPSRPITQLAVFVGSPFRIAPVGCHGLPETVPGSIPVGLAWHDPPISHLQRAPTAEVDGAHAPKDSHARGHRLE